MSKEIERCFPGLKNTNYEITSVKAREYNCIAWAVGDTSRWWWPDVTSFWPGNLPLSSHLADFIKVFELMGYFLCINGKLESGFDKIAIYVDANDQVTHASRQLESGQWTSKLGVRRRT